jgi:transposase
MEHFDELSVEELQQALDEVEGKKPTQRLMVAIAYKHGVTQTELAEWYGVQRRTVYNWLKRFEQGPIVEAVSDTPRPGRPRKLTEEQQNTLENTLRNSPSEVGYDGSAWTPAMVQRFVRETFDVEYSIPSCRRLMKEAKV